MSHTAQAGRATPYPDTAVLFRAEPRRSTPARDRRRSQSNGCGAKLNYPPAEIPKTPPTGIARLAASAPKALERRQVEYFRLAVRSVLNPVNSRRVGFKWSINPYRGCEFGCHYCYARYTHEYMELDPRQFENKIYAKEQVAAVLRRDLEQTGERLRGEHIAIGTATDPYQPAEQRFGVTRAVLETLLDFARSQPGRLSLSLATKSNLVLNDIELLRALARYSRFHVSFTVTTLNARLARVVEPRAPRPDLRLEAVRRLNYASVSSGVFVVPILPGLTDKPGDLEALVAAAAEARAAYLCAGVAFLMPSAQRKFFPLLEEKFPHLAKQYRKWFRANAYAPQPYRTRISSLMRELRSKYNLPDLPVRQAGHWPEDDGAPNYAAFASVEAAHPQLALPFAS